MTSEDKAAGGRRFAPPSGRRRWLRIILMLVGIGALILASAAGVAALWAFTILPRSLPSVTALETFQPLQGTKVYDDNDELLTELHVERRIFVPLAHIPQTLRDAVIATEDRRFYSHFGVDPIGAARAVNLLAVRAPGGGKTTPRGGAAAHGRVRRGQGSRRQEAGPRGPRPHPPRAAANDRPVLPRVRAADARGEVRRRHGLQGRP